MTLNRENWAEMLWINYSKIIGEGYKKKPEQFSQVFKIFKSERAYEKYLHVGTLPPWRRNNEGNTFNESEKVAGPEVTIYMHRYDNSFTITHEYWEDNKKAAMGGRTEGGNGPEELGEGLRKVLEVESARIINEGFTKIGYDGVPLFSNQHPLAGVAGEVCSNIAPQGKEDITNANMEDAFTAVRTTQKDEAGYMLQVVPDTLVVAPDLQFKALRVFHSAQIAGNNWNDKNVLPGIKVVVMDYLDLGIWFLKDSSYTNLVFFWREKPRFGFDYVQKTVDAYFWGLARFGVGYINWRGLYGAKISG